MIEQGLKLNPFYEITRDLDVWEPPRPLDQLRKATAFDFCYRPQVRALMADRPELRPFLEPVLRRASDSRVLSHYVLRDIFRKMFGFAIPTTEGVEMVARLGSVVEIGAGTGYWSALIAGAGAQVEAFDNFSWDLRPIWFKVEKGGTPAAGRSNARALLLCWPPNGSNMAYNALAAFRGEAVVYVGEGYDGCTANHRFHDALEEGWELETIAPSVRWPGLHDRLQIWKRRGAAPLNLNAADSGNRREVTTETPAVQTDERSLAEQAIALFLEHRAFYGEEKGRQVAVQAMQDSADLRQQERVQELAERIVHGFMVPALSASDWREKWKGINRAGGIVAGWSFAVESVAAAEHVLEAVEGLFLLEPSVANRVDADTRRQLTDGLRKRVAEILVFLSGEA